MEGAPSERKQRQVRNTEIQQKTEPEDMDLTSREAESSFSFYLSFLEEQVRLELKDNQARLTQSRSDGRVLLEIQEDLLANFLDELQEQKKDKKWSCEKALMQREISSLKARLDEAHAKQRDIENMKSKLRKISKKAQNDLERQTSNVTDLRVRLEQMKGENEALQDEVEATKTKLRAEKQLRAVAENNHDTETHCLKLKLLEKDISAFEARSKAEHLEKDLVSERAEAQKMQEKMEEALLKQEEAAKKTVEGCRASHRAQLEEHRVEICKITAALKKAMVSLEAERLHLQEEKTSLQESRASCLAQLDEHKLENNKLVAALKEAEQQLKVARLQRQEDKSSHLEELEKSRGTYLSQLEVQKQESDKLVAALKSAEDRAERERLRWQQEKTAPLEEMEESRADAVAQLDEQKEESDKLVAALKSAEQKLESHPEAQEDGSSLLQATGGPEQEPEKAEGPLGSQLEHLDTQIPKKKKKKKWYRKFI